MRSQWIEYKGKKIFYQDFSKYYFNYEAAKRELAAVREIVIAEPKDSVLVLANFTDTTIAGDLMSALNNSSKLTKDHVHKTAVLGVTGIKRRMGDMLSKLTGQPLKYFNNEETAKEWLVTEDV
ncbi:MAG: STAS/SEC14 domain-containing protein [Anaerolineales bacterium]|nr:STAS/SEC14 domain-containing protein [Anaerolineales bacterium]